MVKRHPLLRVNQRQHRGLWPIVSPHLPLPPQPHWSPQLYRPRPFVDPIGEAFVNILLGLPLHAPIDLNTVAHHLHVHILELTSFTTECDGAVQQLTQTDRGAFSAATLLLDNGWRV